MVIKKSSIFGDYSISFSNALLLNSLFGDMLFMLSCRHMRQIRPQNALLFSLFSSVLFNLGSILFWMLSKAYLPDNETFLILYGIGSGFVLLSIGKNYLKSIDRLEWIYRVLLLRWLHFHLTWSKWSHAVRILITFNYIIKWSKHFYILREPNRRFLTSRSIRSNLKFFFY